MVLFLEGRACIETRPIGKLKHTQTLIFDRFAAVCHTIASTIGLRSSWAGVIWEIPVRGDDPQGGFGNARKPSPT